MSGLCWCNGLQMDGSFYVVRFPNGKYFAGMNTEAEEISQARKYTFEWEVIKDFYLKVYMNGKHDRLELVKAKATCTYEILEE